jgi:aryl-alcohol dehydrogenase-like predicted oxidoreductase
MQYGRIPGTEKEISRLVQGGVMLNSEDPETGFAIMDAVFALGCNTIDTAHVYGQGDCERVLGQWIESRGIRDKIVILDKGAHHNADRRRVTPFDITADIFDSLARLKTDYIDLYVLHRDDPSVPVGPIVETLHEHRTAGRIHAFGGSNWSVDRIREANQYAEAHGLTPFVVSSPHFSLAEQIEAPWDDCISITGAANADQRDWYVSTTFPLFCWSSLAGGWFSGRLTRENQEDHQEELYMRCYGSEANWQRLERAAQLGRERGFSAAQIALAYVFHQGFNVFPLVAAYSGEEFAACAAALDIHLSPEECAWLDLRADTC